MSNCVSILDFGAVGDGVTDDTAAINAFHAYIASNGVRGVVPGAHFAFTEALAPIAGNDFDLRMQGKATYIYTGSSSAPGNLVTIGNGFAAYDRIKWSGGRILSATVLSDGWGLYVKSCRAVDLDLKIGDEYGIYSIKDGLCFDSVTDARLHTTGIYSLRNGFQASNGFEIKCNHLYVKGQNDARDGIGIHVGGNIGGFYTEHTTEQFHKKSMRIANDVVSNGNQQIFIGQTTTLDMSDLLLEIEDGIDNPIGKFIEVSGWMGSSSGAACHIKNWQTGKIIFNTAKITNCASSAIYCEDANAIVEIGSDCTAYNNDGYFIDAPIPITVRCLSDPNNLNDAGGVSSNVTVINDIPGQQRIVQNPLTHWAMDFSENQMTLANGTSTALPNGSGKIILVNTTTGRVGEYNAGGGNVAGVSLSPGFQAPTAIPAIGNVSVSFDGTKYRVYNNTGAEVTLKIALLMVRETV